MSPNRIFYFVALSILFLIFLLTVPGQTDADTAKNDDALFIQQAANSASWMIILGEFAQKQAASGDIRQYGATMVGDYRKHIGELNLLARQKGISLSPDTDTARRNTVQFFSRTFGAGFDRNYISLMADEQNNQLSFYSQEAQKGLDAEIRAFASEKIKIIEGYVSSARKILLDLPKPVLK